jgi:hypothetical protein
MAWEQLCADSVYCGRFMWGRALLPVRRAQLAFFASSSSALAEQPSFARLDGQECPSPHNQMACLQQLSSKKSIVSSEMRITEVEGRP